MSQHSNDTIVAIATPPGRGGIGIIRLSGSKSKHPNLSILLKVLFIKHSGRAMPILGNLQAKQNSSTKG